MPPLVVDVVVFVVVGCWCWCEHLNHSLVVLAFDNLGHFGAFSLLDLLLLLWLRLWLRLLWHVVEMNVELRSVGGDRLLLIILLLMMMRLRCDRRVEHRVGAGRCQRSVVGERVESDVGTVIRNAAGSWWRIATDYRRVVGRGVVWKLLVMMANGK